ncbi:MAG TPA: hypothetical protein VFJ58_29040 [Armatimonadota bacterium]|nr:hypothetical protein [Armatimonadota bacterium]
MQSKSVAILLDLPVLAVLLQLRQGLLFYFYWQWLMKWSSHDFVHPWRPPDAVRSVLRWDISGPYEMFVEVIHDSHRKSLVAA